MSQLLHLGSNKWITIDCSFHDGGTPPRYALIGGMSTLVAAGTPPKPTIYMSGNGFFYTNGNPIDRDADISHLPEPFKTQAKKFMNKEVEPKSLVVATEKPSLRKRGRPKTTRTKIEIKDEESLTEER